MNKIYSIFLVLIMGAITQAQVLIPFYVTQANRVSQANIDAYLDEIEALGVKTTGSIAQNNALNWLKTKYQSFGYTSGQMQEDLFSFSGINSTNLVVTKTGTLYPNTYVIICGHYDSINGAGVNDNGSGVSVMFEVARILKSIDTQYSIKFIHFSGEEQGLMGSDHYVENVVNATNPKMNIKLVINLDEVGGVAGQTNNTITCERDNDAPTTNNAASLQMTNQLMTCVGLYSNLNTHLATAYSSDYMPFQSNNEIITGLFEYNESPYRHTINDTKANMDPAYVYQIAKAMVGASMHFAVATNLLNTTNANSRKKNVLYPNPTNHLLFIDSNEPLSYRIWDNVGRLVLEGDYKQSINVEVLPKGIYQIETTVNQLKEKYKFVKE